MISFNYGLGWDFVVIMGMLDKPTSVDIKSTHCEGDRLHIRAENKRGVRLDFELYMEDEILMVEQGGVTYMFYKLFDLDMEEELDEEI